MLISRIILKNWRNFKKVDVELQDRTFIVGPNASGKSNLLDAIRFLRDVSKSGGGLQEAVRIRGGVSKIRCLAARSQAEIEVEAHISDQGKTLWKYSFGFSQTPGGISEPKAKLRYEKVWNEDGNLIINRPDDRDKEDEKLLEYTLLEQPTGNSTFREIGDFFSSIQYLHVVPQLLKDPKSYIHSAHEDYFGRDFLERINRTNANTRTSFLSKIENALQIALPQFSKLELIKDREGVPHLQARYQHWRASDAKQWEDQFSDGTIRLIGFLWSLLDGKKPILLEEPELSLHSGIVSKLAEVIHKLQQKKGGKRQVILTTHSYDLLSNPGISAEETILLEPSKEGTSAKNAADISEIKTLLRNGLNIAEIVIPKTSPKNIHQFALEF